MQDLQLGMEKPVGWRERERDSEKEPRSHNRQQQEHVRESLPWRQRQAPGSLGLRGPPAPRAAAACTSVAWTRCGHQGPQGQARNVNVRSQF